jgi:aminomethyltransferase
MTDSQSPQLRPTPLTAVHERLGAKLTGFAGWLMPLRYRSETAEHQAVRTAAGIFDLSHMGEIMVTGPDAAAALDYALVGQPSALAPGRARYTMICAPDGGVIDDLIVYRLAEAEFLVVANAANTAAVLAELAERAADRGADVTDRTDDYALIAVQGPRAAGILKPLTSADLSQVRYYASYPATVAGHQVLLARTGYTGEDGFELFTRPDDAEAIWDAVTSAGGSDGLVPAGLAARDTLRLEAAMPLYGNELGPDVTPFDAGLGRVVKLDKPGDFVGRAALARRAAAAPERVLVGLTGRSRRIPRHGYGVLHDGSPCGTVTSGAPSPTLGKPIAMAYIKPDAANGARTGGGDGGLAFDIRGSAEPADLVELPFYRRPA